MQITSLRNITTTRLQLDPCLNVFTGANGSGKTSTLEALFLLSNGCSFRSRENTDLISHGKESLTVFAKTDDFQQISIQKSHHMPTLARLNGQPCLARSTLASFLPCQVFYQDIFQLIDAGPGLRRGLLDWGLFHVEHSYHQIWSDYRRALKQRNSLLRQKGALSQFGYWNRLLADLSHQLDGFRQSYCEHLQLEFENILKEISDISVGLEYYKGWDKKKEGRLLHEILEDTLTSDLQRQYTHYGAHNADIVVVSNNLKAKHYLSRGQQKMALFAIKLAQIKVLQQDCLVLVDDMAAELDAKHIAALMQYLSKMGSQVFLTLREDDYARLSAEMRGHAHFRIEDGGFRSNKP